MSKSWIATVQEDDFGAQYIEFTDEQLAEAGWKEGDAIEWIDNGDGSWTLKKKEEMEWVMVEAIQSFRMRYMVQVPKGKSEWALDTVTMNEAKEFSQEALPEVIVSHRVMSEAEALVQCDLDNSYCSSWSDEQKVKAFFTKHGEKEKL
jgi:hypothetical protein